MKFKSVVCALAAMFLLSSCELLEELKETVKVESVSLSESSLVLTEGESAQLTATVLPENATNKNVTWSSSNEMAVKVVDGKVTALMPGESVVSVLTEDQGKVARCSVTVLSSYIALKSLSLDKTELKMEPDDVERLTVIFDPENATDRNVVWSSSDETVATVKDGEVYAVGNGTAVITVATEDGTKSATCTVTVESPALVVRRLEVERLPDMSVPRAGHIMFSDGEYMHVVGGHTDGFELTGSVEYLKDEGWLQTESYYRHDIGFYSVLKNGNIMIGGGCSSGWGVGQTTSVEFYDLESHTFIPAADNMVVSRCQPHAVTLTGGDVVISGNWYNSDGIETFNAREERFTYTADVSQERAYPYIFETAENDAVVFGTYSSYGSYFSEIIVDRLDGTNFVPEVFSTLVPCNAPANYSADNYRIGDFTYIIPAKDSEGQVKLIQIKNGEFTAVSTNMPIPSSDPEDSYSPIYYSYVFTDIEKQTAYLVGSVNHQIFVTVIDCSPLQSGKKAKVMGLYASDVIETAISLEICARMPDGRIAATGGIIDSNFSPLNTAYALKPF